MHARGSVMGKESPAAEINPARKNISVTQQHISSQKV
jgi:hypothetical protein